MSGYAALTRPCIVFLCLRPDRAHGEVPVLEVALEPSDHAWFRTEPGLIARRPNDPGGSIGRRIVIATCRKPQDMVSDTSPHVFISYARGYAGEK